MRREEQSDSLLRLSCSSVSQILEGRQPTYQQEEFTHSASLELTREGGRLGEYANDAGDSIILGRSDGESKEMKNVKSNYDLLIGGSQVSESDLRPTYSGIMESKCESPVSRLKRKYGANMLSPYDKETIVSKSFASHERRSANHDSSDDIELDEFTPLVRSAL